jgi:leucyl/phenylalanyl-tRNA--protein transferase
MIPLLRSDTPFPPAAQALQEPNGLLCAGADLSPERLLLAYRHGIFPWYSPGDPILWWSPDPRMLLWPAELHLSRSFTKVLKNRPYEVRLDTAFAAVIAACAAPRADQAGTWISDEMQQAYCHLHQLGHAHSVETWLDGQLVGGLYGVAVGRIFFGESMFSRVADGSKIALAHLCRHLQLGGYAVIDCQMHTDHLASLGGRLTPRHEFIAALPGWTQAASTPGHWPATAANRYFRPHLHHVTPQHCNAVTL